MSRLNEDVSLTHPGAMKGSLGQTIAGGMEPTTPQGQFGTKPSEFESAVEVPAHLSATAGVPGAVSSKARQQGREEEPSVHYHQPYTRDIHHGEHMFPGVKGHEAEEYEQVEGYASPDDVKPEVRVF
jgi:hypothetical protein